LIENFVQGKHLFVAGSSWAPDEEIFVPFFNSRSDWKMVIAPHVVSEDHLQQLEQMVEGTTVRYSKATPETVGNMVQADFTFADAYFGGSCLRLHGSTSYSRVKLFKTMLDATPQSTLSIVYKKTDKQAATHAHLFVALKGATTQYIEKEITAQTDKLGQWTSFETTLADMGITQDCKVAMIGLRLTNTPKDYDMLVGEVALRDPKLHFAPPTPKVEDVRILRGKHNSFDFKARYTMTTATPTTEKVYNDDVDTWYYEVFCQPEGMPQQLLTATTSWATYVVDAPIMATAEGREGSEALVTSTLSMRARSMRRILNVKSSH